MLMGIRPGPHAGARWGLAAAGAGIAGALMAISYPWSPSVGETFGLTAFVVVTLGGFGSVPGAMYAGLIIGLIQALGASIWARSTRTSWCSRCLPGCCGFARRAFWARRKVR
jgi:branched-chain amino acid transport system permease protein